MLYSSLIGETARLPLSFSQQKTRPDNRAGCVNRKKLSKDYFFKRAALMACNTKPLTTSDQVQDVLESTFTV